jgi:hypothetical protein
MGIPWAGSGRRCHDVSHRPLLGGGGGCAAQRDRATRRYSVRCAVGTARAELVEPDQRSVCIFVRTCLCIDSIRVDHITSPSSQGFPTAVPLLPPPAVTFFPATTASLHLRQLAPHLPPQIMPSLRRQRGLRGSMAACHSWAVRGTMAMN